MGATLSTAGHRVRQYDYLASGGSELAALNSDDHLILSLNQVMNAAIKF